MKIRKAEKTDIDAIVAIELENFSPAEAMSREVLEQHLRVIQTSFLVAEKDGEILGYLEGPVRPERHLIDPSFTEQVCDQSQQKGQYISITSLSIARKAQGLGVGTALLEAMKDLARQKQRLGINLTCHDDLISYYERQGFTNEGRSQSAYAGEVWYDMVWENDTIPS